MVSSRYLSALLPALLLQVPGVWAIDNCPGGETVNTGGSGAKYALCPNTDFQGQSVQILNNVADLNACVAQCDNIVDCFNAVYDRAGRICHIKTNAAGGLNWVVDNRFDVVRLRNDVPELENIAKCGRAELAYTGTGKNYKICRGSDLRGASAQILNNIVDVNTCAQRCSATTGCVKAVYDNGNNDCHLKANEEANTLIWVMNKRFTVIRQDIYQDPANVGRWGDLIRFPVIPVAGYVVPSHAGTNRLLMFSSWGVDAFGGPGGKTQFTDYNFRTGEVSQREVANTQHDMFCPGMTALEDGRMVISGGADAADVTIYNPNNNQFTKGPDMKIARGYQTSVLTSEGKVFELGGSYSGGFGGKTGEIYDPSTNTWTVLPGAKTDPMLTTDAEGIWRTDNHAWLFSWKDGSVFQAGPSKAQNWYNTKGNGGVVGAGTRDTVDAMCGVNVMYDVGKILTTGGSQSYTNSPAWARSHITTIDQPNQPSVVERVPDMKYPRGFANGVVLPDGTTLVTGGQRKSLVFTDTDGILQGELFSPVSKTWKQLAAQAVPRNYHSISILLPDGTVFSGGGGLCYVNTVGGSSANCDKSVDHADGQIFEPPYLFAANGQYATRPTMTNLSNFAPKLGSTITMNISGTGNGNANLVLMRMGSVTHSINSDQRRVPLTNVKVSSGKYTVTLPTDSGVVIPGFYYLFAMSSGGVPSQALTVRISR